MLPLSLFIFVSSLSLILLNLVWLRKFGRRLQHLPTDASPSEHELPPVLVVLSLRGADPFLSDCLRGLFQQNYEDYDIRIVIDSPQDQAWPIVAETIRETGAGNVQVKTLDTRLGTCGLRVSALIQEFRRIDARYQVVAYLDADTIPYPNWLRDLVAPLRDPDVGATTGIRWYVPAHSNMGTLVRTVWNIGAVIQMFALKIAWGGSMAFQARLFRETDLLDKWSKLLWEDTFTLRAMQHLGLRLEVVAHAVLANRERVSLRSCFRYMSRQMLNVRLYHDSWPTIAAYGAWVALGPIIAVVTGFAAVALDRPLTAQLCACGLLLHVGGLAVVSMRAGLKVRRVLLKRGEPEWTVPSRIVMAACLTPFVYLASLVAARSMRMINWRGVRYEIQSPSEVRRLGWEPYQPVSSPSQSTVSL